MAESNGGYIEIDLGEFGTALYRPDFDPVPIRSLLEFDKKVEADRGKGVFSRDERARLEAMLARGGYKVNEDE